MEPTIEEMKWQLFKLYPLGDWQVDVDSWDDIKTRQKYYYYQSIGKIKPKEKDGHVQRPEQDVAVPAQARGPQSDADLRTPRG